MSKTKIRIQIMILLSIAGIISCSEDRANLTIQTNGKITIVDSSAVTENLLPYLPNERNGNYPIYYIGKLSDTIYLGRRKISGSNYYQKDYSRLKNFTCADSTKMKITVDTTFLLTHNVYYDHFSYEKNNQKPDSIKSFKSFAILVSNLSDSLFSVGYFSEIGYIVRQARNEQGNWVDIELPIQYACGTGARQIVLEPKQILVAKLIRYRGDFKTKCRLKFSKWNCTVYSNAFIDYIDKRQLAEVIGNKH